MRTVFSIAALIAVAMLTQSASAMSLTTPGTLSSGRSIVDPDARLDKLADNLAGSQHGTAHVDRGKRRLSILRDDPYLRSAFAWMNNR